MKISFQCPHCKEPIEASSDTVGDRLQCPACAELVMVPAQGLGPGSQVAGFRIEKQLGSGGMGEVFLAIQEAMDRKVALKVLHPGVTSNKAMVDRFIHEVKMSAKLEHPNIVTAFDAGCSDDLYYLAMSFIEGVSLEERLEDGPLSETEALAICKEVAKALDYAWSKYQMLHRDIKPANIMLDESGAVKLMDMGIAKSISEDNSLTMQGSLIGTPYYMSPEQATDSHNLDCRSDIYALGASLYHLVTGHVPFKGKNAMSVIAKHMSEVVPPPTQHVPELSQACSTLICRMMEKDPDNRPADWQELLHELRKVQAEHTAAAALGPSGGSAQGDFDSTAGMTIIKAGRLKQAMAADKTASDAAQDDRGEEVLIPKAAEAVVPKRRGRKVALGLLSLAALAVIGGAVYHQRRSSTETPDEDPSIPVNPQDPLPPNDPAGPDDPVPPADTNPVPPDDTTTETPPDDSDSLRDRGDPRQRVADWEGNDQSPEQQESKELILDLYKLANDSVTIRQDWQAALAAWETFVKRKLRLETLMKGSKAREQQFKKTLEEEYRRMKHMMVRVGNSYVKRLSEQIEAILDQTDPDEDATDAVAGHLQAFDTFLRRFDLVSDFEAAAVQRWEQKKNLLETKYEQQRTGLEQRARAAEQVKGLADDVDELAAAWKTKAAGQMADIASLRRQLGNVEHIKPGTKVGEFRKTLTQRLDHLAERMQKAAEMQKKGRKLLAVPLPELYKTKDAQAEQLQTIKQFMDRLKASQDEIHSPAFIKQELARLEQRQKRVEAIPVEDPWARHVRAGREHVQTVLKRVRGGENTDEAVQDAIAAFAAAQEAGLLNKQPDANLLSLAPPELGPEDRKRLLQAVINPNLVVADYQYLTPKALAALPKSAHPWFRRYPGKLTVLIKMGGDGGGLGEATAIDLALVPPAAAKGYTTNRPFYIGVYEVSVGEYRRFSKAVLGQSIFSDDSLPLRNAHYISAVRYCNWLSSQSGAARLGYSCSSDDPGNSSLDDWKRVAGATGLALPTAAEWTVACFYGADDPNALGTPVYADTVETKRPLKREELAKREVKPNLLGIYCMRGNVAELITDLAGALIKREIVMGRDYQTPAAAAEEQYRQEIYPEDDRSRIGFRLVLPISD